MTPNQPSNRWQSHRVVACVVRFAIAVVPLLFGLSSALLAAAVVPVSGGSAGIVADLVVGAVMLLVMLVAARVARRFIPLVALLQLSLIFPDRAPSRWAVARRAARPASLPAELAAMRHNGKATDAASMLAILELVSALSVHDKRTRGHSERVRIFSDLIAEEMGLTAEQRDRLRWASLLHDIGKLTVPAAVLNKPGRPSESEWSALHAHPAEGARITAPLVAWLGPWAAAVEQHHEQWDGTGYPHALRGRQISLGGRIVAVADAFEVMTATRPYRKSLGVAAARRELVRCAGKQFDPTVVRAFLDVSLGRLWVVAGVGAWLGALPFIFPVRALAARAGAATQTVSAAAVAGVTVAGLAASGGGAQVASLTPTPHVNATPPSARTTPRPLATASAVPPSPEGLAVQTRASVGNAPRRHPTQPSRAPAAAPSAPLPPSSPASPVAAPPPTTPASTPSQPTPPPLLSIDIIVG